MVHTPWMLVLGSALIGYILPEILAAFGKVRVPMLMNIISSLGCALVAAAFV